MKQIITIITIMIISITGYSQINVHNVVPSYAVPYFQANIRIKDTIQTKTLLAIDGAFIGNVSITDTTYVNVLKTPNFYILQDTTDYTVIDDAGFEYLRHNYGDSSTKIFNQLSVDGNFLTENTNQCNNSISNVFLGASNYAGALQLSIDNVLIEDSSIYVLGDYTNKFLINETIFLEDFRVGSTFFTPVVKAVTFDGTRTKINIYGDITDIYDNWDSFIILPDTITTQKYNVLTGLQCTVDSIAVGCFVGGKNSKAGGNSSFSFGKYSTSTADYAISFNGTANGDKSFAVNGTSNGAMALSFGQGAVANGENSFAFLGTTNAPLSVAVGGSSIAYARSSIALNDAKTYGTASLGFGNSAITYASGSIALGIESITKGANSVAMGQGIIVNSLREIGIGCYNDTLLSTHEYEWYLNEFIFTVGNGGQSTRNNAFKILKNGNTYIADASSTTNPILTVLATDSTSTFIGTVSVEKSLQVGNDTTAASAANVGAIRYRSDTNNSYCEMVMQTGASSYAWVVIKQNTW